MSGNTSSSGPSGNKGVAVTRENHNDEEKSKPKTFQANYPYVEPETGKLWSAAHHTKDTAANSVAEYWRCVRCGCSLFAAEAAVYFDGLADGPVCYPVCPDTDLDAGSSNT